MNKVKKYNIASNSSEEFLSLLKEQKGNKINTFLYVSINETDFYEKFKMELTKIGEIKFPLISIPPSRASVFVSNESSDALLSETYELCDYISVIYTSMEVTELISKYLEDGKYLEDLFNELSIEFIKVGADGQWLEHYYN
ncbi:hypothetical protein ACOI1C_22490 [Bacillus sp. DJP31]|uniref:hypothetical protein n=1 Tax=Bacillus sp. DJP31 TaxID=3409789 RepID=UPI003BB693E2